MILCLARPELLDIRPSWGGGRLRAAAIELEPLAPEESEELLDALLADRELSPSERKTLLEKTEGNPLFVEETTRMLLEGGTSSKRIPDTLQAMIAARIDRLPPQREAAAPARRRDRPDLLGGRGRPPDARGRGPRAGPRRPAPARLHHPREPLVDHGRARVPLQARPDPRRRLRGSREGRPRRAAPAGRRLAARASRARSSSRSAPTTSTTRRRCWRSSTARRPQELAKRAAARAREGGPPRAGAGGEPGCTAPARPLRRARADAPAPLPRGPGRTAARRPAGAGGRDGARLRRRDRGRRRPPPGPRADRARRERPPARRRSSPRPRARRAGARPPRRRGSPRTGIEALATRARIGWWLGDLDDDERWNTKALEVAREIGRKDLEASRRRRARELGDRAARPRSRRCGSWRRRSSSPRRAATSPSSAGRSSRRPGSTHCAAGSTRLRPGSHRRRSSSPSPATQWALARVNNHFGWVERRRGDLPAAERRFRDAIRILKPLEDRGTLCESQRGLAQILVVAEEGRRGGALRARGPRDRRPPRHDLPRDDPDGARDRAGRPGPRRGGRGAAARGGRRRGREAAAPDPARARDARSRASCASATASTRRRSTRPSWPTTRRRSPPPEPRARP